MDIKQYQLDREKELQTFKTEYADLKTSYNTYLTQAINDPSKIRFGFIAQDVEQTFISENLGLHYRQSGPDGLEQQYLSYLELIGPLIKVVNQLVVDVDSLKSENQSLKDILKGLEK